MTDTQRRRAAFVTFPEAPVSEENLAAVLITRDDSGVVHAYQKDFGGQGIDPEIVAMAAQSAEIRGL